MRDLNINPDQLKVINKYTLNCKKYSINAKLNISFISYIKHWMQLFP